MAFDFFQEQDEDQQQNGQQSGMIQQLGPESATQEATSKTAGPNSGGGEGTASGAYTNLQSYLDANKSLNFGGQVAGKVQGEVDQAKTAQDEASSAFKGQVDAGATRANDDLVNEAVSNPTGVVGDQQKFSDFLKQRDAEYKGPNNLVDNTDLYTSTLQATERAGQRAGVTDDEAGRKALLDEYYGTGAGRTDYTPGQKKLDNLLIQNDPNSKAAFEKVRADAGAVGQNFNTLKDTLAGYAGQGKADTQAARAKTRAALGIDDAGNLLATDQTRGNGAIQDTVEGLDEKVAARRAQLAAEQARLNPLAGKKYLSDISQDDLGYLGIDPNNAGAFGGIDIRPQGNLGQYAPYYEGYKVDPGFLYGQDPGSGTFLNYTPEGDLNRGSVSTPEEFQRLQALSQLAGVDQPYISNPDQVGAHTADRLSSFDSGRLTSQATASRADLQRRLQAVRDHFTQVQNSGGITDPGNELWYVNQVRASAGLPPINESMARQPRGQVLNF